MPLPASFRIRSAAAADNAVIAAHFYQMWVDNDVPVEAIASNWQAETQQYLDEARRSLGYEAFIAEVDGQIVGLVGCQRFAGLYPNILKATYRQDGYIWGVYVEPAFRRQGIATQLTNRAIAHLGAIGCTHAVLHASPLGRPVYSRLGFTDSNVMRRSISGRD